MNEENDSIGEASSSQDDISGISESIESESDNDVEPLLKYERFGNDINQILNCDSASCLAVHSKFIALGTHWGQIHILDILGNNIRNKELTPHSTTINDLCIDTEGNYIGSCSDDGKVVITGLYTNENSQIINFERPIKSVALDPLYSKSGSNKGVISGDDKLILHEKSFLSRLKTTNIHQGDGSISCIKWCGQFVAWSTNKGVHVYDLIGKRRISFVARCKQKNIENSPNRCCIYWQDGTNLLIGQDNSIQVCSVLEQVSTIPPASGMPRTESPVIRYIEIMFIYSFEFTIYGVVSYKDRCVILSNDDNDDVEKMPIDNSGGTKSERPYLRTVDLKTGEEMSKDLLTLRGSEKGTMRDYRLECSGREDAYYIVGLKDIVVARPRDEDDHVDWMIDQEKFEQARDYAILNAHLLKKHTSKEIGFAWFDYLMDKRKFDKAAQLCPQILGRSKELWEDHVCRFIAIHHLSSIAIWLPTHQPRLDPTTYEAVLHSFLLAKDASNLYKYIHAWPFDVYRIEVVINMLMDYLKIDRNNQLILESLAQLYALDHQYEKALYIYVRLGHKSVFDVIRRHDLFEEVLKYVVQLLEFDRESTLKLLVQNHDKILPERVATQLDSNPEYLFEYLDRLRHLDVNAVKPFSLRLIQLYCKFDSSQLLSFLRTTNHVPLQSALQLCQSAQLHDEVAYLLDRMGNPRQALVVLLKTQNADVKCVEFCHSKNDAELWQDLLDFSIDKPEYLCRVLENVDSHVDTHRLISRIPDGMEIPRLRNSLVRILHDFQLLISLSEGCMKILLSDCIQLTRKFVQSKRRALCLSTATVCAICSQKIVSVNPKKSYDICSVSNSGSVGESSDHGNANISGKNGACIFRCGHNFHHVCLESIAAAADVKHGCVICTDRKR